MTVQWLMIVLNLLKEESDDTSLMVKLIRVLVLLLFFDIIG